MRNINEQLNKFNLLTNYNPSKTLKENKSEIKLDEQQFTRIAGEELGALKGAFEDAFKSLRDLQKIEIIGANGAKTVAQNVDELLLALKEGRVTPRTMGQVNAGLLKSAKTPENVINSIINNSKFDQKFMSIYGKYINDEGALRSQLKTKGYPDSTIEKMIERTKGKKSIDSTPSGSGNNTANGNTTTNNSTVNGNGNTVTNKVDNVGGDKITQVGDGIQIIGKDGSTMTVNITSPISSSKASEILAKEAESLPAEAKAVAEENAQAVRNIGPTAFQKMKSIAKKLNKRWLWKLGFLALGGYLLYKFLFGSDSKAQGNKRPFPSCAMALLDDEGVNPLVTSSGDLVINVTKTGVPEYDQHGGLKFYENGRISMGDNSKKGTYKCKGTTAQIAEQQSGNEVPDNEMTSYVEDAVDDLDGWVAAYNLKNVLGYINKLKGRTYKGKDAVQAFLELYSRDEGGDSLTDDVKGVGERTIGAEGIRYKDQIIAMTQNLTAGMTSADNSSVSDAKGDGNPHTGLSGIEITWDGQQTSPAPSPSPTPAPNPAPKPKQSMYHDCSKKDFPFEFGCIHPKIAEIQNCLGIEPSKGYFGPKTKKALLDDNVDISQGISKETYDRIIANCKNSTSGSTIPDVTTTGTTQSGSTEDPEMIKQGTGQSLDTGGDLNPPATPEQPNYDESRLQELLASKNLIKKRNGTILKWKGPELEGNDYYILNKFLEDRGYVQKKQREVGDEDDNLMKYKWKKEN